MERYSWVPSFAHIRLGFSLGVTVNSLIKEGSREEAGLRTPSGRRTSLLPPGPPLPSRAGTVGVEAGFTRGMGGGASS